MNDRVPLPHNETERLAALKKYQIMDSLPDEAFDRLTELASLICGVPVSLIGLFDEHRQWYKAKKGLDATEVAREDAFCRYAILDTVLLEVEDAAADERFLASPHTANPATQREGVRFYASQPLTDKQGYVLGTLCVLDTKPHKLTDWQRESLRLLGQQAIELIENAREKEEMRSFERLFVYSDDLMGIISGDKFIKLSPSFGKIFGWEQAYMLSTPFAEFAHPEDLPVLNEELAKLAQGLPSVKVNLRIRTVTGSYRLIQWVTTPEAGTGFLYCIGRDITEEAQREAERFENERKFRTFFENSLGLMCTYDLSGRLTSINRAGAARLGYLPEELIGKSLVDITPDDRHENLKTYLNYISVIRKIEGSSETIHRKGNRQVWLFGSTLEKDASGEEYVFTHAIEITVRQQLEDSLRKTSDMLERTSQLALVGGWEFILKTEEVIWSPVTRIIHEVDPDFVPELHSAINFYKAGESRQKIEAAVARGVESGESWDEELQIITATGREKWVRSIGYVEYENGEMIRMYGTFQDIDERKKAAVAVASSRKQLDDVLNSASTVGIIAADTNGTITVFNKGAEYMLGYSASEIIGLQTPVMFHDAEEVEEKRQALMQELGQSISIFETFIAKARRNGVDHTQWTYIRKDGFRLIVSLSVTPMYSEQGDITGFLGIVEDITERIRVKDELEVERARLSAFIEHTPVAVAMFDNSLRYIAITQKWLEEYKLTNDIIGRSHYEVFPNIPAEWKALHQRALKGEVLFEDRHKWRPDGWDHDQYLLWEIRPWYNHQGEIGGILMLTQDITNVVSQQEELRTAKLRAEEASVAKSEFLANMSHEIRTPLNGIIGFTDLSLKTELSDTQQQYLSIISQSANTLLSTINDILDFSKIEAGKLELDIEKHDLFVLGSESAEIISYQAQEKGLEVLLNLAPDLPRYIYADNVRLKQVLVNLLGNAVKFTAKGEVGLKISEVEKSESETLLRFEVKDSGIGIQPEKQQKIFEAFQQENSSTTKKYGGTGLGLTISNRLLNLMGSKLQVDSEPGKGSRFFFDIWFHGENNGHLEAAALGVIKTVLVVDDNENNRHILREMLSLEGVNVKEAKDGFEAVELMRAPDNFFDVIIMDYHMPEMDGIETIRKIKADAQKLQQPVVLLHSSSSDEKIFQACRELGIRHRLVKPVRIQDMYAALKRIGRQSASAQKTTVDNGSNIISNALSILVAEDNLFNKLLAKTILTRVVPNGTIIEASDGLEAVAQFEKHHPDLVFMDIQMPGMNGYEATRQIRQLEEGRTVPIIALTASNTLPEQQRAEAAGMNDFMTKPFVEAEMASMVIKWFG